MKKLTKKIRNKIYIVAKKRYVESPGKTSMCHCLGFSCIEIFKSNYLTSETFFQKIVPQLTEFIAIKPRTKEIRKLWWPIKNSASRLKAFDKIIENSK